MNKYEFVEGDTIGIAPGMTYLYSLYNPASTVCKWATHLLPDDVKFNDLVTMNDDGASFETLANYIEENL